VATLALWFGPELWGSGNPWRAGQRAHDPNPNSLAFADHPALEVVRRAISMTPAVALVGMVAALAQKPLRLLGLAALAWLVEVAIMTEAGFSGNARYLIAPVALACVAGGAALGRLARRVDPRVAVVLALAAIAPFAALRASDLRGDARAVRNEARLMDDLSTVVRASGGAGALRRCGSITTGPFQVTALAWRLDVPIDRVGLSPRVPGTVFRAGPLPRAIPHAPPMAVRDSAFRPVARSVSWQALSTCK
jgi:hypothetical protein